MRKNIKCFLIFLLIFTSINSYAQIFYYSEGKKISLQRDTTKLFVNINKTKVGKSFLTNFSTLVVVSTPTSNLKFSYGENTLSHSANNENYKRKFIKRP